MSGTLDKLMQLRGVTYDWNNETEATSSKHLGFIAQEVEAVFPEFVDAGTNGIKGVAYGAFTPVLLQAIKEQQGLILSYAGALSSDGLMITSTDAFASRLGEPFISAWDYLTGKIVAGAKIAREVVAEKVTALVGNFGNLNSKNGSIESGLTTKDKSTGEFYCMYVDNGVTKTAKGKCEDINPTWTPASAGVINAGDSDTSITTPAVDISTTTPATADPSSTTPAIPEPTQTPEVAPIVTPEPTVAPASI